MTSERTIIPVILSGGSGTRLWPLSRASRPKQFINLVGESSLFQMTVERLQGIDGIQPPLIVCNQEHRFLVAEQLAQLGITDSTIILEPEARNTAAAICTAAIHVDSIQKNSDAVLLVLPADHLIKHPQLFHDTVQQATDAAQSGDLVTFGIRPDFAATGYGYIKTTTEAKPDTISPVEKFVEKPDLDTAQKYIIDKHYVWNSGMFMFKADAFLAELELHCPGIEGNARQAYEQSVVDLDFIRLDKTAYDKCKTISVDYAVMEHSQRVVMLPLKTDWNDVGTWSSLWQTGEKDKAGNVSRGDVWLEQVNNSYIHADHKLIAVVGVDNLAIVETKDSVMITRLDKDQDIKNIVARLVSKNRPEANLHRQVYRPWGNYDCIDYGHRFQVKRICVKPGEATSLQKHRYRAEHWIVVTGCAEVTIDEKTSVIGKNESVDIPIGATHRLKNPGDEMLELIEVQSGSYLGEDDIERLEDYYGRQ